MSKALVEEALDRGIIRMNGTCRAIFNEVPDVGLAVELMYGLWNGDNLTRSILTYTNPYTDVEWKLSLWRFDSDSAGRERWNVYYRGKDDPVDLMSLEKTFWDESPFTATSYWVQQCLTP
jgi:hypothetical protein